MSDQPGMIPTKSFQTRIQCQTQLGLEPNRSKHPDRILIYTGKGITNKSQATPLDIIESPHIVDHRVGIDVVVKRVDGEVSPVDVLVAGAKNVVPQNPPKFVFRRIFSFGLILVAGPVGGHLDHFPPYAYVNNPEPAAHYPGPREHLAHLFRGAIGHDIEIFRALVEQQVSNTTPDQIRTIPCLHKGLDNLPGAFTYLVWI